MRNYELATLATARALRSSYCALAHGSVLASKVFDADTVTAIATDAAETPLEPGERALMAFAEQMARRADQITAADIEALRSHGYRDEEIGPNVGEGRRPPQSFPEPAGRAGGVTGIRSGRGALPPGMGGHTNVPVMRFAQNPRVARSAPTCPDGLATLGGMLVTLAMAVRP